MNRFIVIALFGASLATAQDQTPPPDAAPKTVAKKKAAAKSTAKTTVPPVEQPLTIPKDAVANPDGTYAYTDKAGKQWTYSKTPFGVSKIAKADAAAPTSTPEQTIKSTDRGDTVLFEKPSPFGVSKWEKKKSEMTDKERSIFQSQHPDNHQ